MRRECKSDGILDSLSKELYPNDFEKQRGFRKYVHFVFVPTLFIMFFFAYYFIFIANAWTALAVVVRAIFLSGVVVVVLLLSSEDMEWRLITVGISIVFVSIDIMGQVMGLYDDPTILGESLHFDFLAHAFGGIYITLIFSSILPNGDRKILWVILASVIVALLWELFEYVLYSAVELFMNMDIEQFNFYLPNSLADLLAHGIGLGLAIAGYIAYKYIRCPSEYRQGLICKL